MKQRFSSLDVKVIAHELNTTLVSLRVSNIYDLSSRIFLIKCAKPGKKAQLLVDSGFRAHLTSFSRTANSTPSAFVSRLRKYLKTRRITCVAQIGTDRVIELSFSDGQYRLFLEFFAAGNIVLTDAELNVLALLRQVSEGDEDVDVKLGGKYVLESKQNFHGISPITDERIKTTLQTQIEKTKAAQDIGGKKAKRHKAGDDLRKALSAGFSEYPPHLLEHVFTQAGLDAATRPVDVLESEAALAKVAEALQNADEIFHSFETGPVPKGYIIAKSKPTGKEDDKELEHASTTPARHDLLYDDFHPFRPSQFDGKPDTHILEFDGFNQTVDEFFSSIESQRLESRLTEREEAARKKLELAKNEHEKRLDALQQAQETHVRKAQTIEANSHRVEEAIAAVNGLVAQGMDWVNIAKLIENEQKAGNVVANMIKLPLKLYENTMTLLLDEPGMEEESDDEGDESQSEDDSDEESVAAPKSPPTAAEKRMTIDVDLGLSSYANARQYYDQKKTAAVKEQRTVQASTKALKSIEKKTEADLKKGLKQEKAALRPARKQFWFEKFLYFVSSDGYLVIGGKDAQQNELLYRRYLKKGDLYVHADLHGASSVIIKNDPMTPDAPIPPSTLSQAGALTVCTSSAWDSKAVMAAWWVYADQVSKTAPTGEYLNTGGFIIRGKKNFLPPTQLILGFGVMWLISEDSRANHGKHRLMRTESMVEGEAEMLAADAQGLNVSDREELHDVVEEGNNEDATGDIEDVGDKAEQEVEDDTQAATVSDEEEEDDDDDDDDKASTVASEAGEKRYNPLQTKKSQAEPDDQDAEDTEADQMASEDKDHAPSEGEEESEQEDDDESKTEDVSTSQAAQTGQSQGVSKKARPKRGANTRAKRLAKEKYALQTDEERALAMSLLGSTKGQQEKKESEEIARQAREAKSQADRERRRQQHERAAEAERRRLARLENAGSNEAEAMDEDDAEQLEQERRELQNIDLLVPAPAAGDELVAAIPVVAPWSALARTKYKVKLQPGSVKKGKMLKEVLAGWSSLDTKGPKIVDEHNRDKDKIWLREVELVKSWKVEEVVGVVPVKGCRIVQSGGGGGKNAGGGGKGRGNPARGSKKGKK